MLKITAFYYLAYPDEGPPDPTDADTELRIEIGSEETTIDNFDSTYCMRVITTNRLERLLHENGGDWIALGPALIVSKLDDAIVKRALEFMLLRLDDFAKRV